MYKINTLKNGLRLITVPMRGTKTATILVMVGTGSKYEIKKNSGISHFLEHMFFKGTGRRPTTLAIASELDSMGAEYNAFTGKEYTGYWAKTEAGKIKSALDVVSDILLNPKLAAEEIAREKGVIIEELNMYLDNPIMYIEDVFEKCLYGDTPAGWDTIGTRENILRFKRRDFVDYLAGQYSAHNTIVCLAGNIGGKNIETQKYFSSSKFTQRGEKFREKEPVRESQLKPQCGVHYKKTDQAHLSLGTRAFGYGHQDRLAVKMMSIILGGSMSSRLFIGLRERQGLAYYVRTETEFYTDSGYLTTRAGVPVNKLPLAIKIILTEYKKLKNILVKAKELQRAKDLLRGRLTIQLEESDNMASWYGRQLVMLDTIKRTCGKGHHSLKIMTPKDYLNKINKITAKDIKQVAGDIFTNQGLNLATIGPYKDEKKFGCTFDT